MEFLPSDLIRKKRFGGAHTRAEIQYFIQGYAQDKIPDYQMAAWLMAICCRGMTGEETTWLTQEMRDSGTVLDLRPLGVTVDKHSTGGVGDKVSLILAPLVAAAGVPVPMMAGRGLGHTGGTLDKLESIAGFSVRLSFEQFQKQVHAIGTAIMGQTAEMCPADRKLYALRDVTGTIDSLPLICGSIMSKKLAEGMAALVLDVKVGSGAFMKTADEAERLAVALMDIGVRSGHKVTALLTRMDEPLGRFVGNALEVQECLDVMSGKKIATEGKSVDDLIELTLELAGHMIFMGEKATSTSAGKELARTLLTNGSAAAKFVEVCRWQGGDLSRPLPKARSQRVIKSEISGFMEYINVERIGSATILLGAGRRFQTDVVNPSAGIEVFRSQGEPVAAGAPLFTLFADSEAQIDAALAQLLEGFKISSRPTPQSPLILKVLT
jgi:pyrimidine-nucleoside phosphorylase